mmetsp:Transcript_87343/g.280100  ORF Transcript_87343/g.280100 Transcript_87343/m.280100 type:complete len:98 (-) Transcript_87343:1181-1474(-)
MPISSYFAYDMGFLVAEGHEYWSTCWSASRTVCVQCDQTPNNAVVAGYQRSKLHQTSFRACHRSILYHGSAFKIPCMGGVGCLALTDSLEAPEFMFS